MAADRLISVLGLGFGDCGKGACTDFLVRRHGAHTVVRCNGGAQAGHNVVLPDGRHHTFSQLGAGTFVDSVHTVLAQPVVVHPTALLVEAAALAAAGVGGALERLLVDPRCRVTTPYHQAAGRLRELQRGGAAHGSCGAGFGATVGHALTHADEVLRWRDLGEPLRLREKLAAIRATLRTALREEGVSVATEDAADEWRVFDDEAVVERWVERVGEAARRVPAASLDRVLDRLARPGTLVCEGAQGALLDENQGFHPHTTWSTVSTAAVEAVVAEAGRPQQLLHVGVVRSYLTRHGAGPLPTEDAALDALAEPHNADSRWQGRFRRGHLDAVLLRYALDVVGGVQQLVVTHLDAVERGTALRWSMAYRDAAVPARRSHSGVDSDDADLCERDPRRAGRIVRLRVSPEADLAHAARLGALLGRIAPVYEPRPLASAGDVVERLAAVTGRVVAHGAFGPTHAHFRDFDGAIHG